MPIYRFETSEEGIDILRKNGFRVKHALQPLYPRLYAVTPKEVGEGYPTFPGFGAPVPAATLLESGIIILDHENEPALAEYHGKIKLLLQ